MWRLEFTALMERDVKLRLIDLLIYYASNGVRVYTSKNFIQLFGLPCAKPERFGICFVFLYLEPLVIPDSSAGISIMKVRLLSIIIFFKYY